VLIGLHAMVYDHDDGARGIGPRLRTVIERAEDAGVHSFWPMDHFFQIPPTRLPSTSPMLEAYAQLAWAAGFTTTLELGALVTGVHHRSPGVLVKTVTTLDVLSGGRAWLGLGAGWNETESRALGIPMPALGERFERLEGTLQVARQMFDGDAAPFNGTHFTLTDPVNSPPPVRRPPILIGGSGERKTLRLVAQYADACNLFDTGDPATIQHKLDVLKRHCDDAGRSYDDITRTALTFIPPTRGDWSATFERLDIAGIDLAIIALRNLTDDNLLKSLPDLVADAASLGRTPPPALREWSAA
jgi:F420-dependent oxidoreductase-like protein